MSAFLGPIHFWLYNKIQFQESLIDELVRVATVQGWSDEDLADKYCSISPYVTLTGSPRLPIAIPKSSSI